MNRRVFCLVLSASLTALASMGVAGEWTPVFDGRTLDGWVNAETGGARVTGFVSSPEATRGSRSQETFIINRRWVRSKLLLHALEILELRLFGETRQGLHVDHVKLGVLGGRLSPPKAEDCGSI